MNTEFQTLIDYYIKELKKEDLDDYLKRTYEDYLNRAMEQLISSNEGGY